MYNENDPLISGSKNAPPENQKNGNRNSKVIWQSDAAGVTLIQNAAGKFYLLTPRDERELLAKDLQNLEYELNKFLQK